MKKMKFLKANLNNHVRVKLNERDKIRVLQEYNRYVSLESKYMTLDDLEKYYKGDGYYELQHHEFITIFGDSIMNFDDFNILIEVDDVDKDTSITMGVGEGGGNMFVHGDHESILHLREKLFELENLRFFKDKIEDVIHKSNFN